MCCAKTAEQIEVLFGMETLGDPSHGVLDEGHPIPLWEGKNKRRRGKFFQL